MTALPASLPGAQKEQRKWVHNGTEKHEIAHRPSGGEPDRESLAGAQGPRLCVSPPY